MPANATVQKIPFFQRPSQDADGQLRSSFVNTQSGAETLGTQLETMPHYWARPAIVVPALSLPQNSQIWVYYLGLPNWDPREPALTFWGFVNALLLGGVSGSQMDLYFWRKPYGATAFDYLGGWRWSNMTTPNALWLNCPLPDWAETAIWSGDVLGVSLMAVGASLVINSPFSIDIW